MRDLAALCFAATALKLYIPIFLKSLSKALFYFCARRIRRFAVISKLRKELKYYILIAAKTLMTEIGVDDDALFGAYLVISGKLR